MKLKSRPCRTNTQKRKPLFIQGTGIQNRKPKNSWNNRQIWPWSTERSRANANRVLPRECKHPLPTTQEMTLHMDITRLWILKLDWLYSLNPRWRISIQSVNIRQRVDYGSDPKLLIAKFGLKLKKVGKTSRPFWYDLNQMLCNYTVEVTNRFKGLDLIDRVPEELWMEVCDIVQEAVIKNIPK